MRLMGIGEVIMYRDILPRRVSYLFGALMLWLLEGN